MAPPSHGAVRRVASSKHAPAAPAKGPQRAPLRVVPSRRRFSRRRAEGSRRLVTYLPLIMVVLALLAVVVGQAMLANGQVRMTHMEQRLQVAQQEHRVREFQVSQLETPTRIVGEAISQLHMVHPSHVTQVPNVPLNKPLPTPNVTPASGQ